MTPHDLLTGLLDGLPVASGVLDERLRWVAVYGGWESLVGRCADSLLGRHVDDVFESALRDALRRQIERAREGRAASIDLPLPDGAGGRRWGRAWLAPWIADGRMAGVLVCVSDVTQQRRVEEALRREIYVQRVVLEHSDGLLFAKDLEGRYLAMNAAARRVLGRNSSEIVGHDDDELFPGESAQRIRADDRRVIETGEHLHLEEHVTVEGRDRIFSTAKAPLRDPGGAIAGIVGHAKEITTQKRAETEARLWKHVFENAGWGIVLGDSRGERLTAMNPAFAEMHGYTVDELVGRPIVDILAPYHRDEFPQHVRKAHAAGRHLYESDHVRKDGSTFPTLQDVAVVRDERGEVLYRAVYTQDLSERRRAEQALRESRERTVRIVESAMDAIVTVDEHGVILLFNSAAERAFRCPAAEAIGQGFERFAPDVLRQAIVDCMDQARDQTVKRYMWSPEGLIARRADGEEFAIEATISQATVADRDVFTLILRDVEDRRQAERELRHLRLENIYLREEVDARSDPYEVVGRAPSIRAVLDAVEQVAVTDSTVLLLGETGTGKELIAQMIHERSPRREQRLVSVNCAALPPTLIESELFGHEKGAFTGATARKVGRFELADGGTIFLDEIGDLPLELQVKLLRVLQESQFERVGGGETLRVDVRVLAATHADLEDQVRTGRFRTDLFYRLNVFPVWIPPLRERREDIPLLVRHFATKFSDRLARRVERIPRPVLEALSSYHWPGNVRELQNVIERATILSQGPDLELGDWWHPRSPPALGSPVTLTSLDEVERAHIRRVLQHTGWRVGGAGGAAELLGLKRTTLNARMKKLGIQRDTRSEDPK